MRSGNSQLRAARFRGVKGRAAFYGSIVLALTLFVLYATSMPGASYRGEAPPSSAREVALQGALKAHITALARTIGERRLGHGESLTQARDYILSVAREIPNIRGEQIRLEDVPAPGMHAENVVIDIPGASRDRVIIGAHYDSAVLAPGADDNASGVAATLELVRLLAPAPRNKALRFVLFANEEPPYFQQLGMGSLVHARGCRGRGEQITAMLSLESIGYYSDNAGSQKYPWPVGLLYPDRGNFLGFVSNLGSRSLLREAIGAFRATTQFPSEGAALPAAIPGVAWSDQWAFWQQGYPAIMVTDTAPFRNPHYHEESDSLATIDFPRLARVTLGLAEVAKRLAD